jgi:glycosyltransferase involved in cell wall biosynthesis
MRQMTPTLPSSPPPSSPPPDVCILLAVYQGEKHLQEQLDSYTAQSHANWSLLVSDDGSGDGSGAILSAFQAAQPGRDISIRRGPCRGFARNFLSLLQAVPPDVAYAALSDQDDVWFADKLARARARLAALPADRPALYCAATLICDETLAPLGVSPDFPHPPDFRNALVQSIGGGNTMVLNRAALDLAAAAAAEASDPVAHDWWLYQLITGCGGQVIRDDEPALFYRQHDGNLIGANLSARASLSRILALLGGRFRTWNDVGLAALEGSMHRFTPEARAVLQSYVAARTGPPGTRLRALRASGVYRQGRLGMAALYIACALRRL